MDQVINDVVAALQTEKGYSKEFATQQILNGGLKIYTTMDRNIQAAIESVYTDTSNFPGASNGTQSAMVVIDPYTGQIKGMAGGIGKNALSYPGRDFYSHGRENHGKKRSGSQSRPAEHPHLS